MTNLLKRLAQKSIRVTATHDKIDGEIIGVEAGEGEPIWEQDGYVELATDKSKSADKPPPPTTSDPNDLKLPEDTRANWPSHWSLKLSKRENEAADEFMGIDSGGN